MPNELAQVVETQPLAKQPPVWFPTWEEMMQIGDVLARSNLMPNYLNTSPKIVACLLVARDMGLPPSIVMRGGLYPVNGVISANGALIMAILQRSGLVDIKICQDPKGDWVEVTMKRRDSGLEYTARWDEKRVQESKANWDNKNNQEKATWRFHRMIMKTWRAVTEAGRFVGSDLLMGLGYTYDEFDVPCQVKDGDVVVDATVIGKQAPPKRWNEDAAIVEKFWSAVDSRVSREKVLAGLGVDDLPNYQGTKVEAWDIVKVLAEKEGHKDDDPEPSPPPGGNGQKKQKKPQKKVAPPPPSQDKKEASGGQGNGKFERPASPEQVRKGLWDKAAKHRGDRQTDMPATKSQIGLAAGKLEEVFAPDKDAEQQRRSFLKYIFERDSFKELDIAEVAAVLDWLVKEKDEATGDYPLNPLAVSEAKMVLRQHMEDSGQASFDEVLEVAGDR